LTEVFVSSQLALVNVHIIPVWEQLLDRIRSETQNRLDN